MRPSGIKFHYFSGRSDAIVFIGRRRIKRPSFPLQSPPQERAIQISLFSPAISSPWRESLWLLRVWPLPSLSWPSLSAFVFFPSLFSPFPIAPFRPPWLSPSPPPPPS